MNLADFLRQGPMGQQRQANDSSFNRDADLARMSQSYGSVQAPFMDRLSTGQVPTYTGNPNDVLADSLILGDEFNRQRDAKQSEQLMNMMPGAGITAWHGSPHKFTKFDMSKIGTGEGAQAYGHGLYMAENPKVAKEYANAGDHGFMVNGKSLSDRKNYMKIDEPMRHEMDEAMRVTHDHNKGDLEAIKREVFANAAGERYDGPWQKVHRLMRDAKSFGPTQGNEYKVDIPDDQIAKMLDWDKPLSEQGDKMHNVWEKFLGSGVGKKSKQSMNMYDPVFSNRAGNFNQPTGEDFHNLIYEGMPRAKGQTHGGGATFQEGVKTAEWLKRQGIPGIKYLDGGSRSGGQGTSNFVLFADEIAEILERNGQPIGDLAEGLKNR